MIAHKNVTGATSVELIARSAELNLANNPTTYAAATSTSRDLVFCGCDGPEPCEWDDVRAIDAELARRPASSLIDPGAASAVLWFFGDPAGREPGTFTKALLEAFAHADESNRARLNAAFPSFGRPFLLARSARNGQKELHDLVEAVAA
jgi:hypothetical protein